MAGRARDSDPPTAVLAAQALTALADSGDRLGPPLVTAVAPRLSANELESALDEHYQAQLESMTAMRRRVAQAATLRKNIELQLAEMEPPPDPAGLRERLAAAIEAEERLTAESQREQMQLDAFRTRKEVLKAAYTAAEAVHLIEQAQAAVDDPVRPDDPTGAAGRLDEITGQIEQELGLAGAGRRPDGAPPGRARRQRHPHPVRRRAARHRAADRRAGGKRRRAGPLPRSRPPRLRGPAGGAGQALGQAAETAVHTFGDAQSFLEEFFPGRADEFRR